MWCYFYSRTVTMTNQSTILVTLSENKHHKVEKRNLLDITIRKCGTCAHCLSDKALDNTTTRTVRIVRKMNL